MFPGKNGDGHFTYFSALAKRHNGYEALQLAVNGKLRHEFTFVSLEAAAKIVNGGSGNLGGDTVGARRRSFLQPRTIGVMNPPSAHNVIALFEFLGKFRNVDWAMLQIAVHSDDETAGGYVEAGAQRG